MATKKLDSRHVEAGKIVDMKGKRTSYGTETITTHHFPSLLPFGMTTIRTNGFRWKAKCGWFELQGESGDLEWIVLAFVNNVKLELDRAQDVIVAEEFGNDNVG